jgi:hypothetical protein
MKGRIRFSLYLSIFCLSFLDPLPILSPFLCKLQLIDLFISRHKDEIPLKLQRNLFVRHVLCLIHMLIKFQDGGLLLCCSMLRYVFLPGLATFLTKILANKGFRNIFLPQVTQDHTLAR